MYLKLSFGEVKRWFHSMKFCLQGHASRAIKKRKKFKFGLFVNIYLLESSKLEFVLKKLFKHFEMLIVLYALHCVAG